MLERLKGEYPNYNWPERGAKRDYPEESGATIGDIRQFGKSFKLIGKSFKLTYRSSNEQSVIRRVAEEKEKGKSAVITYNSYRLETYGVWIEIQSAPVKPLWSGKIPLPFLGLRRRSPGLCGEKADA